MMQAPDLIQSRFAELFDLPFKLAIGTLALEFPKRDIVKIKPILLAKYKRMRKIRNHERI